MYGPIVAIVGRPNVGKSALFNRILGSRHAIVEETPGVTRDRVYAHAEWRGRVFSIVDTGGIYAGPASSSMEEMTIAQTDMAIGEADVVWFVVDTASGLMPHDHDVADILRRSGRKVIVVANKAEGARYDHHIEFYALGLGSPHPVSAIHGIGIGDLLDKTLDLLPETPSLPEKHEIEDDVINLAVLGRPNVGKSSLVNCILGEERAIVTPIPGTTRDALDTPFVWNDKRFVIIDTAGIRRMAKIDSPVERYSVFRALRAADRCDVALIVLDAQDAPASQDARIAGYVEEAGQAMIIVANKSDLIAHGKQGRAHFEQRTRREMPFISYAPLLFVSALKNQGISELMEVIEKVVANHRRRIETSVLNEVLEEAQFRVTPPQDKGKQLKIYYGTQVSTSPPSFALFMNYPNLMNFSYRRYLENTFRQSFDFQGVPLRILLRKRG
ncbi:MAG: ribosome biogenesis GTPase Der [Firmicutes bacterium]|jgi:GTP-binding protein|nr:ribosome biogenesis GTPase Der [Bacillota bacterium]